MRARGRRRTVKRGVLRRYKSNWGSYETQGTVIQLGDLGQDGRKAIWMCSDASSHRMGRDALFLV